MDTMRERFWMRNSGPNLNNSLKSPDSLAYVYPVVKEVTRTEPDNL